MGIDTTIGQASPRGPFTANCRRIIQETHDVRTFQFVSETDAPLTFQPGQFATLHLEIGGQTLRRCYTLSSSPGRPQSFSITVKRVPGGQASNWLHDNLKVGDCLRMDGPAGQFVLPQQVVTAEAITEKLLFLSGGSGITPSMSMLRWIEDTARDADVAFAHFARTPDDIIFGDELALLDRRLPGLRLSLVSDEVPAYASWAGYRGRLTCELLRELCPDFMARRIFVCGPAPFMAAARQILTDVGFAMERHHEESFGSPLPGNGAGAATEGTAPPPPLSGTACELHFEKTGKRARAANGESLLDAAQKGGVWINSGCQMGFCGSCKVKKTNGEVRMDHSGGITDAEIAEGYILACCSYASSDLSLDL